LQVHVVQKMSAHQESALLTTGLVTMKRCDSEIHSYRCSSDRAGNRLTQI